MNPMDVSENCSLNINLGNIYVNSGGDGLDSNGSLNIKGGYTFVDGPENDGNSAIDSGSEINIDGGILIAAGSSGMLESPSENSKQNSIVAVFDETKSASTPVYIEDENGNALFSYTPQKQYSSVIISSPSIESDKNYSIYTGGSSTATETEFHWKNYCEKPEVSNGELLEEITSSDKISKIGDVNSGQMKGGIGHGGRGDFGFNGDMQTMPTNAESEPDIQKPDDIMMMPPDNNGMPPQGNPDFFNNTQ